jgi:hypothetical protein
VKKLANREAWRLDDYKARLIDPAGIAGTYNEKKSSWNSEVIFLAGAMASIVAIVLIPLLFA